MYKIYFNDISKNDKIINEYFPEGVSSINDYIEKIYNYSVTQIEKIDKEIKEYIFLTSNKENIRIIREEENVKQDVPPNNIGGKKYRKTKNKKYQKNKKPTKKRRKRKLSRKK